VAAAGFCAQTKDAGMKSSIESSNSIGLLTDIIENAPIRIFWKDRAGCYLGCNTLFATDAGFERVEQLIGKTDFDMGWKDQAVQYRADDTKVRESGEPLLGFEEPQTTPDGKTIWLRTSKVPLHNDAQEVIGILGIYEDITARKEAEISLADSEERLRLALNTSNQAWFDLDIATGHAEVSPEYPGMLGYSNDEFDSSLNHWMGSLHPEDRQSVLDMFEKGLRTSGPESIEYRRSNKSGEWIWIYTVARIIERDAAGHPVRMVGIQADVTSRIQVEQRLTESEHTYRGIFNTLNEAVYILDEQGIFLDVNEGAVRMYGFPRDHFIGKTPADLSSPGRNDMGDVVEKLGLAFNGTPQSIEFWACRSNGEAFPKEVHLYPGEYFGRRVVIAVAMDITARKQAGAALQKSELRLQQAQTIGGVGVWDWDLKADSLYWSEAAFAMLGYAVDEIRPSFETFRDHVHPDEREMLDRELQATLATGETRDMDFRILRKDGSEGVVHLQGQAEYDAQGHPDHIMGTIQDITRRKQNEEALRTSEERLQQAQVIGEVGVWDWNPVTGALVWTEETYNIFGYAMGDVEPSYELFLSHVHPEDRESLSKAVEAALHKGIKYNIDCRFTRTDGREGVANAQGQVSYDASGNPARMLGTFQDVSKRKQIEERLRTSEERFSLAMAGANDGLWDWNLETDEVYYSPRWFGMLGYAADELPQGLDTWRKLVHPDDMDRVMHTVEAYFEGRTDTFEVEMRLRHKDGHEVVVLSRASKVMRGEDGRALRLVGTHVDITDRKIAEDQLREALSLQSATLEATADGILVVSNEGKWSTYNSKFVEMWRIPDDILDSGDDQQALNYVLDQLADPQAFIDKVMALYAHPEESSFDVLHFNDGRVFERYSMEQRIEGRLAGRVWSFRDVSERSRTEQELRMSKFVMENAPYNITFLDEHAKIHYMNKTGRETFGLTEEEPQGMSLSDIDPGLTDEIWRDHWQDLKQRKRVFLERKHRRKNGDTFPVEIIANYMQFGNQAFNAAFDRDISDKKLLEEQLRESHKMEAIGTLVGGIAHDFNNMLAAIQGNVFLARMQLQGQPGIGEKIDNIEQLGNRAAEMVRQLLTFARKDRVNMLVFSLTSFLNEGFKLLHAMIPENIDHRNSICAEDLLVLGDATQLQQVLMNLMNNAIDAVAGVDQPAIRCCLDAYVPDEAFCLRHPDLAGDRFACLSLQDNGCGIDPEYLDKIFEPFFTTKEVGKGTGLGLSMLYGAVQTHGGVVDVESKPGNGSIFKVYLPLCEEQEESAGEQPQEAFRGQGETILLVDDQQDLRNSSAQVLEVLGYTVLQAATGIEALKLFAEHRQHIALILSDVVMPEMGGVDLLKKIRTLDGHMPFILTTGYDKQHVLGAEINGLNCKVLTKPFDFNMLSSVIHGMMHV